MLQLDGIEAIIAGLDWTSNLSRGVVAVIYGYFDDSGSEEQDAVGLMAGYVAHASDWRKFENKTKRLFEREEIPFFRAKLFEHGQKHFRDWKPERKLAFAQEWYGLASRHLLRGISSASVRKDLLAARAKDSRKVPSPSVHAYCMQIALRHLCDDNQVWAEIKKYGLYLVIETSTWADEGIRQDFNRMVGVNKLEKHLRSIAFAKKQDSRALQLADYLAYYSHRFALTAMHDSHEGRTKFLNIAQDSVTTIMKLGHRFQPNPSYRVAYAAWKRQPS